MEASSISSEFSCAFDCLWRRNEKQEHCTYEKAIAWFNKHTLQAVIVTSERALDGRSGYIRVQNFGGECFRLLYLPAFIIYFRLQDFIVWTTR